jgi:pentatricopeptide repeat protein
MMNALVCNNSLNDALALFDEWKHSVPVNTFMYSTLIKGLTQNHKTDEAMQLYQEMKEKGVELNTYVFTTLIDAQARKGATEQVVELVQTMEKLGCKPDAITNSTIIKGYVIKGDIKEAFEVFSKLGKSSKSDDSVYNTLIDGCVRHQRMDIADQVLADMERHNVKPSNVTMSILVKMYGRRKQLRKAFEVVEECYRKYGLEANSRVKSSLMCACLSNNDMAKAYKVFEEMKSEAHGVDAKSYGTLIQTNVRNGNLDEAVRLVREAYGFGQRRYLHANSNLEEEAMEHVMKSIVQKGESESLGKPLLEELRAAKIPVSCRVLSSMFSMS